MSKHATMNDPDDEQPRVAKKARLECDLANDEKKEEITQEKEGKVSDVVKNDRAVVAQHWSPQRASRVGIKVHSLADGNLRDGDFVLDADGNACTISFLFKKDDKVYGLTAGRIADMGDQLEVFGESKADDQGNYQTIQVGMVVSKDVATDSLIFEVCHPYVVARIGLLKVSPKAGLDDST